jgi:hypothetical protein
MGATQQQVPVDYLDALKGQRAKGLISQSEYEAALRRQVRDARATIARFGQRGDGGRGYEDLPPDTADVAIRNAMAMRAWRARVGSGARSLAGTALGAAFGAPGPMGSSTFFGGY